VATDQVKPPHDLGTGVLLADLTDHGQAAEVLAGTDAVVHLANIPAPEIHTPGTNFNANMTMNFNVFLAAAQARLERVVWASSETTLGLPFEVPPKYAPVDEDHYPFPTTTYALSKVASETIAAQIAGWSGVPFIALRFSNILGPADYERFPPTGRTRGRASGTCGATSMSGTRRRRAAGAGGTGGRQRELHHCRGGHGDEPVLGEPAQGGLPRRAAHPGRRRVRVAAGDRPGRPGTWLCATALLARPPRCVQALTQLPAIVLVVALYQGAQGRPASAASQRWPSYRMKIVSLSLCLPGCIRWRMMTTGGLEQRPAGQVGR
jgi:hypothetical protein